MSRPKGLTLARSGHFPSGGRAGQAGKCVLYASSELSEIVGITDRVYVMYDGGITKELTTQSSNEEELLLYCTGGGLT